jgi:AAA domain
MSTGGFVISRLVVTGQHLPDAEISFEKGFNVLTGPSNTGKSYIVECINYMFGAEDPPGEDIDESKGYDTVFLELTAHVGARFTLERSLRGGDVNLYETAFANRSDVAPRPLAIETQTRKGETLSAFFLSLTGINDVKVRTNASGETGNLTFRMISNLFLVNETRIIAKDSPVRLASGYAKTASERTFNYLITGEDDHSIIALPNVKEKAQTEGKKELYDDLISELDAKLKDFNVEDIRAQLAALDRTITAAVEGLGAKTSTIQEYQLARQTAFNEQHDADSRLLVIGELLTRFDVLKEHYNSDLQRLEFIGEGDYYFDQLIAVRCPVCGTSLDNHAAQKLCSDSSAVLNDVQEACRAEAKKIRSHLGDLDATIKGLQTEHLAVVESSRISRTEVFRVDNLLANELRPTFENEKRNFDALIERRRELADIESPFALLDEYRISRARLENNQQSKKKFAGVSAKAVRLLCDVLQELLREWNFLDGGQVVEFNESKMDIVVGGKPRQSNGKGLRGFLHGAFTIGLMHYCRANNLPHPGCVILDSPVTSYREGKVHEAEDEASPEIQAAFWASLAKWTKDEQIILIENKEPTESARALIHYIHFYGEKSSEGRNGFFPSRATAT